jgi:multimeric flavodoxin WrbA
MPITVFIIFYSRCGVAEKLALAAAVGAVQARASIRLRRLPDLSAIMTIEDTEECRQNFERMRKEYVAPLEKDLLSADAFVFVARETFEPNDPEWGNLLSMLSSLCSDGLLNNKPAAVVAAGDATVASLAQAIAQTGLTVVAPSHRRFDPEQAIAEGRRIVATARDLNATVENG